MTTTRALFGSSNNTLVGWMVVVMLLGVLVMPLKLQAQSAADQFPSVEIPTPKEFQVRDRPLHPYLMASEERIAELKHQIQESKQVGQWYKQIKADADQYLTSDLPKYTIYDGLRLLHMSRRTLNHVQTLALVYRIEGDKKYADRVWKELETASRFPDWNPKHFLDVGEMTHAFAIGYDWLYDYWSDEQRRTLADAIAWHGLNPAVAAYRGTAPNQESWWTDSEHNWNQVTNGGIGVGALAVMEEYPRLASKALSEALKALPLAMQHYAPDGAWDEGPGYWHYATRYNTYILAALNTTYGTDFGLSGIEGYSQTGWYPVYMTGPSGRSFNFSDSGDGIVRGSELFWLAERYDTPGFAQYQHKVGRPDPLSLIWLKPSLEDLPDMSKSLPLDKYFRGTEAAVMRSGWGDEAIYAGIMAGDNKANHSNLDLGTFVVDAQGVRWATELGSDDYNMPGYFSDSLRWTYYRMRPEGQNVLVINPGVEPSQHPKGATTISRFTSEEDQAFAVTDLTDVYGGKAKKVRRGLALTKGRQQVLVQDEVAVKEPSDIWWFMHTEAAVSIEDGGKSALLTRQGKRLRVSLLSPSTGQLTVMDARPLPGSPDPEMQAQNKGVRKLAIHLEDVTNKRIAVTLTPLADGQKTVETPQIKPLAQW